MTTATTVQAAVLAPQHPALRWTPIDARTPLQHARATAAATVCGTVGILTLADTTDEWCGVCFPTRGPATA